MIDSSCVNKSTRNNNIITACRRKELGVALGIGDSALNKVTSRFRMEIPAKESGSLGASIFLSQAHSNARSEITARISNGDIKLTGTSNRSWNAYLTLGNKSRGTITWRTSGRTAYARGIALVLVRTPNLTASQADGVYSSQARESRIAQVAK